MSDLEPMIGGDETSGQAVVTGPPSDTDWDRAVLALAETPDAVLLAHVSPDADALGSALAVRLALQARGIRVAVSFGEDPFVVPRVLSFLPGVDDLVAPTDLRPAGVAAAFDLSSGDRLGVARPVFDASRVRIAFDHHRSHHPFADISIVDPERPATADIALELIDRLGVELDRDMATCLYAGLLTDTGSFRFAATTSDTHLIAARLLETGISHHEIARRIYDDEPFTGVQLLGSVLSAAELEPDALGGGGFVYTTVPLEMRRAHGLPLDALERVIDVLRTTTEAEVTAVLKQDDTFDWRVSMRSKGDCDVSAVAAAFGGGGHRSAAGYTATGTAGDVLDALRAELERCGA